MTLKALAPWLYVTALIAVPLGCKGRRSSPSPVSSAVPSASTGASRRMPNWESTLPGGYSKNAFAASVVGETLLAQTPTHVIAFDRRNGQRRWSFELRYPSDGKNMVAGDDVVMVVQRIQSGSDVTVLDLVTGKRLWQMVGGAVVFANAVFTHDCSKGCSWSRRDLRSGKPLWTISQGGDSAVYLSKLGPVASGSLLGHRAGPYVMLASSQGKERRIHAIDATTGTRYASIPNGDGPSLITDQTLVALETESTDCKQRLHGVDIRSGKTRWRLELRVGSHQAYECPGRRHTLWSDNSWLGVTPATLISIDAQGRPIALDLDTGAVRWRGPTGLVPVDADQRTVLVRDASGMQAKDEEQWGKGRLAALDAATGKLLWRAAEPPGTGNYPVTAAYGDFALDGFKEGDLITVRDATTGAERQSVQGSLTGAGPGWVVATYTDKLRYHTLP